MPRRATKDLALKVIRRLRSAGHEALLAGGCVRDMLMGRRPTDYDLATSATPQEVRRLFRRVLMVGAKFGVAIVLDRGRQIEVATFRSDLSYSDGRRPDAVRFVSAREDARRRDFTINGMFYDPVTEEVVDYVGGRADLARGVIRAIGKPQQRFSEDHLRMLRAVRFAARLDFRVDKRTAGAVRRNAAEITHISGERIRDELEKMLSHPSAGRALRLMHDLALARAVLPELFADAEAWPAALRRVEAVARSADARTGLTALLCGLTKSQILAIISRWGGSNRLRRRVCWVGEHLTDWRCLPAAPLGDLKRVLAHPDYCLLERLWRVGERAATGGNSGWRAIRRRASQIDPGRLQPQPLITGADLMSLGLSEGPRVGRVLRAVYEAQLNERVRTRAEALEAARRLIRR